MIGEKRVVEAHNTSRPMEDVTLWMSRQDFLEWKRCLHLLFISLMLVCPFLFKRFVESM